MTQFSLPRTRRAIAMLVAVVMILGMLPVNIFAADTSVRTAKVEFTPDGMKTSNMSVNFMNGTGTAGTPVYDSATGALKLEAAASNTAQYLHLMGTLSDAFLNGYDGKAKVKITFVDKEWTGNKAFHFVYNGGNAGTSFSTSLTNSGNEVEKEVEMAENAFTAMVTQGNASAHFRVAVAGAAGYAPVYIKSIEIIKTTPPAEPEPEGLLAKVVFNKGVTEAKNINISFEDGTKAEATPLYDEATGALKLSGAAYASAEYIQLLATLSPDFLEEYGGNAKVKITFYDKDATGDQVVHFVYADNENTNKNLNSAFTGFFKDSNADLVKELELTNGAFLRDATSGAGKAISFRIAPGGDASLPDILIKSIEIIGDMRVPEPEPEVAEWRIARVDFAEGSEPVAKNMSFKLVDNDGNLVEPAYQDGYLKLEGNVNLLGTLDKAYLYGHTGEATVKVTYMDQQIEETPNPTQTIHFVYSDSEYNTKNAISLSAPIFRYTGKERVKKDVLADAFHEFTYWQGEKASFRLSPRSDVDVPLLIKSIEIIRSEEVLEQIPVDVDLIGENPTGLIFFDENTPNLQFAVSRLDGNTVTTKVNYRVKDYTGATLYQETWTLENLTATPVTKAPNLSVASAYGTYELEFTIYDENGKVMDTNSYPFSHVLSGKLMNILGVCCHTTANHHYGDWAVSHDMATAAGINFRRDDTSWAEIETTKGVYDYTVNNLTNWVKENNEQGNEPYLVLNYANNLYSKDVTSEEFITAYAAYAKNTAAHFTTEENGIVNYYEIWNEYNTGGKLAVDYCKFAIPAIKAVHEGNPDAKIIVGVVGGQDVGWLEQVVDYIYANDKEAYAMIDGVSIHPYCVPRSPEVGFVPVVEKIATIWPEGTEAKKVYISEMNWPTVAAEAGGNTMEDAAAYLVRMYPWALANSDIVEAIFIYDMQDDGVHETDHERNYGLLHSWMTQEPIPYAAKPGYAAISAMTYMLDGATDVVAYDGLGEGVIAYKAKVNNKDLIIAWCDGSIQNVTMNIGSQTVTVTDMFGNPTEKTDTFGLSLSDMPVYLSGDFSAINKVEGGFALAESEFTLAAGMSYMLELTRSNGYENISGRYNVSLPVGWATEPADTSFTAGTATTTIQVNVPVDARPDRYELSIAAVGEDGVAMAKFDTSVLVIDFGQVNPALDENGDYVLAVEIQNEYGTTALAGTIAFLEPVAWFENQESISFTVAAGENTTVTVPVPEISNIELNTVKVKISLEDGREYLQTKPVSFLTAAAAIQPIIIDGVIDDQWNGAEKILLDEDDWYNDGIGWDGDTATIMTKWDEQNLYFAIEVKDASHYQASLASAIYQGDSVQISIDPSREISVGMDGYNELGFALNNDGELLTYKWSTAVADKKLAGADIKIIRDDEKQITTYEAAIPWTCLVPVGSVEDINSIGFSMLVNDNDLRADGTPAGRAGYQEYMSGIGKGKDTAKFGDLILSDMPATTEEKRTAVGSPVVTPGENLADVKDELVSDVVGVLTPSEGNDGPSITGDALNDAITSTADKDNTDVKDHLDKLDGKDVRITEENPAIIVIQQYMDIEVTGIVSDDEKISEFTLDIKPMFQRYVTTLEHIEKIDENNAEPIGEPEELEVSKGTISMKIPLPNAFQTEDVSIYIHHTKDDGRTFIYEGEVVENDGQKFLVFTNPHGFSEFRITTVSPIIVDDNDVGYNSLQLAIDNLTNSGTLTLLADCDQDATVSEPITFMINENGFDFTGNIKVADGLALEEADGTYTVTVAEETEEPESKLPPMPWLHVINVKVGEGGSANASGELLIAKYASRILHFTPDEGYEIADVLVNGKSVGAVATYRVVAATANMTIEVQFAPIVEETEEEVAE